MSKIIQIAVGTWGNAGEEGLLETELYALDDEGCVHVWTDCNSDERRRGGWSGWSEVGSLGRRHQKPPKEGDK